MKPLPQVAAVRIASALLMATAIFVAQAAAGTEQSLEQLVDPSSTATIKPGDKISIAIEDQSENFVVSPTGFIYVKGLGELRAAGLTVPQTRDLFTAALHARKIDFPFDLYVIAVPPPKPKVHFVGAVNRPGMYDASTLLELLTISGGARPDAREAIVRDSQSTLAVVRIENILDGSEPDIELSQGWIVYVPTPASSKRIAVYGAVNKPGPIEATTVLDAVGKVFGLKDNAARNRIQLHRPDGTTQLFDYELLSQGLAPDSPIEEGGVLFVPEKTAVLVSGAVRHPGWVYAETARDVLRNAGGITDTADSAGAFFRTSGGETSTLDIAGLLDSTDDMPLLQGDEVVIPERALPRLPLVRLEGAVASPGLYHAANVSELLTKSFALPTADLPSALFYDTYGRPVSLPESGAFPFDGTFHVPARATSGDTGSSPSLQDNLDSNVVVSGYGVKTSVHPPGDLRKILLASGYAPGRSNITMRVYRRNPRRDSRAERGQDLITLDLEKVINGRVVFETRPGDAVYVEEKVDPINFILRILGFGRAVESTARSFGL